LAYHAPTQGFLVAEAGINAVGVIDKKSLSLAGHVEFCRICGGMRWLPFVTEDDAAGAVDHVDSHRMFLPLRQISVSVLPPSLTLLLILPCRWTVPFLIRHGHVSRLILSPGPSWMTHEN
jgi:hypothetical protein